MRLTGLTTYRTPIQPNLCILALESDQGAVGLGESFWPAVVAAALSPYSGFDGSGTETRGNGAVDIALWDLLGRHSGQAVMRLLGGPMAPRVRVYNTCAGYEYVKTDGGPYSTDWWGLPDAGSEARPYEDLEGFMQRPAELTRSLMDEGYTGMKVWPFDPAAARSRGHDISSADLRSAMSVVEAIRAEAGDAMDILIELHSLWSLKAATRILKALEDIAPFWVEDPMRLDSVDGYRRLRERVDVPIAGGEPLTGARRFKPLLDAGALDVAIVDPGWTGGITETVRIASPPTASRSRPTTAPAPSRSRPRSRSSRASPTVSSPRPSGLRRRVGTRGSPLACRRSVRGTSSSPKRQDWACPCGRSSLPTPRRRCARRASSSSSASSVIL